ncbi:MAG: aminopeptidase [Clostridia bacterium]|nr:aminopeptidase [Clostridia bacterium]
MKKTELRKYARLIARKGVNVQKGQSVIVCAELEQPEFVAMVVEECYRAGAAQVSVEWTYVPLTRLDVRFCKPAVLEKVEDWQIEKIKHRVQVLPAMIYLISDDPDALSGINMEKYVKASQKKRMIIKPYRDEMENKYTWCIAAVPGKGWAKKLFPGERASVAMEKLWQAILSCSRALGDPEENWEKHNEDLHRRCDYLNSLALETLEYKSANGTDFRVGLIPNAQFLGGSEKVLGKDVIYNPNIPSEEIFVSPMRGRAEGIVYSTKPLVFEGTPIENFSIRFENGKAVEVHAEKNEELLKKMIEMDEGAAYLGECALVPYASPIRESGILFYNTLFDENAACHLALGMGFSNCIKDYEKYSLKECQDMGINDSVIHEDFMIGSQDLDITGITKDGKRVPIFRNGNWAF